MNVKKCCTNDLDIKYFVAPLNYALSFEFHPNRCIQSFSLDF